MDYKKGFFNIKINTGRILLLLLLVLLNIFTTHFITENQNIPLWFNSFVPMFAAAVDGPVFGVITAVVNILVQLILNGFSVEVVLNGLAVIALAAMFGLFFKFGCLGAKRGLFLTILLVSVVDSFLGMSISIALYGGINQTNSLTVYLFDWICDTFNNSNSFIAGEVSYFLSGLVDKSIVILLIYGIIKNIPDKIAKFFSIEKEIPVMVFVNNASEEEFKTEQDRIKQKAQDKIDKAKENAQEETKDKKKPEEQKDAK